MCFYFTYHQYSSQCFRLLFLKSLIDDYIAPLIGQSAPSLASSSFDHDGVHLPGRYAGFLLADTADDPRGAGHPKTIRDDMFAHMQTLPIKLYFDTHVSMAM